MQCIFLSQTNKEDINDVHSATLPTRSGTMQVLNGHAESFVLLTKGDVRVVNENKKERRVHIEGGFCHIRENTVTIIL